MKNAPASLFALAEHRTLLVCALGVLVCLLTACTTLHRVAAAGWPRARLDYYHTANAAQALTVESAWLAGGPHHYAATAKGTGSMRPHIHGGPGERLLLTRTFGRTFTQADVGRVALFYRDRHAPRCLHMIAAVSRDGRTLYLSGTANAHSDGWIHHTHVEGLVAHVLRWPAPVIH